MDPDLRAKKRHTCVETNVASSQPILYGKRRSRIMLVRVISQSIILLSRAKKALKNTESETSSSGIEVIFLVAFFIWWFGLGGKEMCGG